MSTGPSTRLALQPSGESCSLARGTVRRMLERAGVAGDVQETAVLLTNELVINAIEHGGGAGAHLDAAVHPESIRIEVVDSNPAPPTPRTPADLDERGRGLMLIAALASRWGTTPILGGKSVWCEIDLV